MVKICGLRSAADAVACREAGATMAGLNFVSGARRAIRAPTARAILAALGPCAPVLVYRDDPLDQICIETEALGVRQVQLHGSEPPERCAELRRQGLRVIKALPFSGRGRDLEAEARRFVGAVDAWLIDAPSPGSGRPLPWGLLADLWLPRPFLLAGGLTPDNVAQAVAQARPDGVDVASGIERDGRPCPALMARFAASALAALSQNGNSIQ